VFDVQTIPINNDPDFRDLEAHADAQLAAKGHKLGAHKGSSSWTDQRIKPPDAAVRFKLAYFANGIFFGAREDLATQVGVALNSIGSTTETVLPSTVRFRGDFIQNDAAGKRKIDSIISLFP
jgi:hypothetical protein